MSHAIKLDNPNETSTKTVEVKAKDVGIVTAILFTKKHDAVTEFIVEPPNKSVSEFKIRERLSQGSALHKLAATKITLPKASDVPQGRFDGLFHIKAVGTGRNVHVDGLGDKLASTRLVDDGDYTLYTFVPQGDGSYKIRLKANQQFLRVDGAGDKLLSTRSQANDDFAKFVLERQADGSYRIRIKASGNYLHEDGENDRFISTRYQIDDRFTRFRIVGR